MNLSIHKLKTFILVATLFAVAQASVSIDDLGAQEPAAPAAAETTPVATAAQPETPPAAPAEAAAAPAEATTTAAPAAPKVPVVKNATPEKLQVFPADVLLTNVRDRQSMIAQMVYSNGITVDVTNLVDVQVVNPALVKLNDKTLAPAADGETTAKISIDSFNVDVPIKVTNAAVNPPIGFTNDVMPVFSKAGCNAGSCHGAAREKTGSVCRFTDLILKEIIIA